MQPAHRSLVLGVFAAIAFSGCGVSSNGSSFGTSPTASGAGGGSGATNSTNPGGFSANEGIDGTHDSIVGTPPSSLVSVEVGMKHTVAVTFNSSDGRVMTGFGINNSLSSLPAGWTGPATFGCATVGTGNGCVLNLVYQPTAYTLPSPITLNFVFVDNSNEPQTTGPMTTMTFNYQATTNDNVVPALSPMGQINATVNEVGSPPASQTLAATFTTDDGHPASNFAITGYSGATPSGSLPAGWSPPAATTCATVSAGGACQMAWVYTPTAPGSGTIVVQYSFNDDSGTLKTSSFNIPYAATAKDNAVSTVAPTGPVVVVSPASQNVTVTFTTDDTFTASNLLITSNLSMLPNYWSTATQNFGCATFDTGNTCQLTLTYAPQAADLGGTLQLTYSYFDNAGEPKTGAVNIPYSAQANDSAVATVAPASPLALVSPASQAVTVTFTTSDGFPASNLVITSNLASLPPNWSTATPNFSCAAFSTGSTCTLTLTYAPPAPDSGGTLHLTYSYTDDAGDAKNGSADIVYSAT